jgi:antitoxin (DNA-binding transcriptional repressor) of toxin-antitoxin stability system
MKTASIRDSSHRIITVRDWVPAGETVEIQKRGKSVANLIRTAPAARATARPGFAAQLKSNYGDMVLTTTAAALLADE